jgi:hypothetical protein
LEELFDLLEETGKRETEQIALREQLAISLPMQVDAEGSGMDWIRSEQNRETPEHPGQDREEARTEETEIDPVTGQGREKAGAPGDLTELILVAAEEVAIQMSGRSTEFMKSNTARNKFGGEFSGSGGEHHGPEGMEEVQSNWLAGAQPWHEPLRERLSGADRLYVGINTPRLRGSEQGGRNVVVHLNEPEQRVGGMETMDIRTLDRVFQRDARRYDGGLNLL